MITELKRNDSKERIVLMKYSNFERFSADGSGRPSPCSYSYLMRTHI